LATIVQRTSDKVYLVNRWKKPGTGLQLSGKSNSGQVWNLAAEKMAKLLNGWLNYRADAEPATCKIICVPLSNFTFRLAELTTEP